MKMFNRIKSFSLVEFIDASNSYDQLKESLSVTDITYLHSELSKVLFKFSDWVMTNYNKEALSQSVYEITMEIFLEIFISHMYVETFAEDEPYDMQIVLESISDSIINELEGFVFFNGIETTKSIEILTNELIKIINDDTFKSLERLFSLMDISLKKDYVNSSRVFTIVPIDVVFNREKGRAICKLLAIYNN